MLCARFVYFGMGARYSHSRLGTYRTCPCKYKFRYITREQVPKRISADLYMGAAVHEALRRLYELAVDNVIISQDDLIGIYRAEWEKPDRQYIEVFRDFLTVEDYIANGERMLRRYYETYHPFDQGQILGVEETLNFILPGTPFRFTARIDLLWRRADETVELSDFKTGRRLPHGPRDPDFFDQMALYQLGVQATYPQFEQVAVAQYFLKHNEVVSWTIPDDELDAFAEGLRQEILQVEHSVAVDDFPTREGQHCNYCDYARLCPAQRHRYILNREEGVDAEELGTAENAAQLAERYIDVYRQNKELEAELAALKEDLLAITADLGYDKLVAQSGEVTVKRSTESAFVTKTEDFGKFLNLSDLLQEWGLTECMTIDRSALKKMYAKKQFSPEQLERLKQFVTEKTSTRINVRQKKTEDDESGDE